jgi:hypothetical protein
MGQLLTSRVVTFAALAALGLLAACNQTGEQGPAQSQAQPHDQAHGPVIPTVLHYACTDGLRFTLNQDTEARTARLVIEGREGVRQLEAAVVASGYAYYAEGTRFHAKEDGALLQLDSDPERTCQQVAAQ